VKCEIVDSLRWIYSDSHVSPRPKRKLRLAVARGGTASAQALLDGIAKKTDAKIEVPDADDARIFRLIDVPVEENTGVEGGVEKEGVINPHVTRRAPFRVFDAMQPIRSRYVVESPMAAFVVQIPIGGRSRPSLREYRIRIQAGKYQEELALEVEVFPVTIPPLSSQSTGYVNWHSSRNIAQRHGLEMWSRPHWRMLKKYAQLMARGRQNMFWVPLRDVFVETADGPKLDKARLRRYVRIFTDAGLSWIAGGHLARRTKWGVSQFVLNLFPKLKATSPKGNAALADICGQLMAAIRENGWQGRWVQHVADEPFDKTVDDYRILAGMVRKYMPGVSLMDAVMNPNLAGAVDIWVPISHLYEKARSKLEDQRRLGDRIWTYTCCAPGGKYLNRFLDQPLLNPTLLMWGLSLYGLDGFLHWGLNMYRPSHNPFKKNVVRLGGPRSMKLPAGDTHVVYPGTDAPWPSARFEAHREGLEDCELLRMLKRRSPRRAETILRLVIRSFRNYTRDVTTFRKAQRKLLQALS